MSMYSTLPEANTYFADRLNNDPWEATDNETQTKALKEAARRIDRLNFIGDKADDAQALEFPRGEDTVVPEDVKIASYEIAFELLDGKDPELELETLQQTQNTYGQARVNYNRDTVPAYTMHGIPSALAWGYLLPFLRDAQKITLSRIN